MSKLKEVEVSTRYRHVLKLKRDAPNLLSRTVDLVFKEPEGWVIADYKTDKVDRNLDALMAYYRPQVEMYRRF